VSPTSIVGFPEVDVAEETTCSSIADAVAEDDSNSERSHLKQPVIDETVTSATAEEPSLSRCATPLQSETEKEAVLPTVDDCETSTASASENTSAEGGVELEVEVNGDDAKPQCPSDGTESFDPFDLSDQNEEEGEGILLFDNVDSNTRWNYISNIDGKASMHPTCTWPQDRQPDQVPLAESPTKTTTASEATGDTRAEVEQVPSPVSCSSTGSVTTTETATKEPGRVAFNDIVQVRYFARSPEEILEMRDFAVMSRRQIRWRRRRSRSDPNWRLDEDFEGGGGCKGFVLGDFNGWRNGPPRNDEASFLPGIVLDVWGLISDALLVPGQVIQENNDRDSSSSREEEEAPAPAVVVDELDTDTMHVMAINFLDSMGSDSCSIPTTSSPPPPTPSNAKADQDDDEPWFWKAMRCGDDKLDGI